MKKENLKDKSVAELKKMADDLRIKLHTVRYSLMAGRNKNVKEGTPIKKTIARIETILMNKGE